MFQKHSIPEQMFLSNTRLQELRLDGLSGEVDEIILWFDHDLFDQLMLCYLLSRLSALPRGSIRLSLIQYDPKVDHQITQLYSELSPVTEDQLTLAVKVWTAYSASEPLSLAALTEDDLSVLPFLKMALAANYGRYPSMHNGLSVIQQLILEEMKDGEVAIFALFQKISRKTSEFGLGDLQFWSMLEQLHSCEYPLLLLDGGGRLPKYGEALPFQFENWRVRLTDMGKLVLTSKQDHLLLNGIDEWIGGVHLFGKQDVWRRNAVDTGFQRL